VTALLTFSIMGYGQDRIELEKKKKDIEKKINYTNSLLKETKINKVASLNQLVTLKRKIGFRKRLISTINTEINLLDKQIEENHKMISSLETDLEELKTEYADMIYYGYKNRSSYSKLVFIFSSKDFSQAQKRLKYIQDYANYRQKQADIIKYTRQLIDEKNHKLEARRQEKKSLLLSKESERTSLKSEKLEKNNLYNKLKSKEEALKKELKHKQKEAGRLQKAISDIIAEELRKEREAAKKVTGFALTPEESRLSSSFKNNKGQLPWPVKRGIITGQFGEHNHPVLAGIKIYNNGIDLSTNKGAIARAIFNGKVTGVILIPGGNKKAVIMRHGEYFSVYGNLKDVYVKKGDKITIKQELGTIYTDTKKFKTEGHLEIWKITEGGSVKLDPEEWIVKRRRVE
jgi:septal ring factor EnvC (AmiA/AmiB activator)